MWKTFKIGLGILAAAGLLVAGTAGYKTIENKLPYIENVIKTINDLSEMTKLKCTTEEERKNDPKCNWAKDATQPKDAP